MARQENQLNLVKQPRARLKKWLAAAKSQECTMRTVVCNHDLDTTVAAHLHSCGGMGMKNHDYEIAFMCSDCHTYYDQYKGESRISLEQDAERAKKRTMYIIYQMGLMKP